MFGVSIWMAVNEELHTSVVVQEPGLLDNATPWNGLVYGLLFISLLVVFASTWGLGGLGCENSGILITVSKWARDRDRQRERERKREREREVERERERSRERSREREREREKE